MTAVLNNQETAVLTAECDGGEFRRAVELATAERKRYGALPLALVDASDGLRIAYFGPSASVSVPVQGSEVQAAGAVSVYASELAAMARALPAGTVRVTVREGFLQLEYRDAVHSLITGDAGDVLDVPKGECQALAAMDAKALRQALERVAFAAEKTGKSRWALQGVHVRIGEGVLTLAASDTFRLPRLRAAVHTAGGGEAVLPNGAAALAMRALKTARGRVKVTVRVHDRKQRIVELHGESFTLRAFAIEAQYPAYERIIPERYAARLVLDREAFAAAVQAVAPAAAADINRAMFRTEAGKLWVTAAGDKSAQAQASVCCAGDMAEAVAFNCRYLLDGLRACGGELVTLGVTGPASVACLWPGNTGAPGDYLYLIMPMRPA